METIRKFFDLIEAYEMDDRLSKPLGYLDFYNKPLLPCLFCAKAGLIVTAIGVIIGSLAGVRLLPIFGILATLSCLAYLFVCRESKYALERIQTRLMQKAKENFNHYRGMWIDMGLDPRDFDSSFYPLMTLDLAWVFQFHKVLKNVQRQTQGTNTGRTNYSGMTGSVGIQRAVNFFGFKTLSEINASKLKKRYHELCKKYHPDTGVSDDAMFQKLTEYYNLLKETV